MGNGSGKFKVVDRRAGAEGQILDAKGEPIWGTTPRKTLTQSDVLDRVAEHFRQRIDKLNLETVSVQEFRKLWREETEWAMDVFRRYSERHPEIEVPGNKVEFAKQLLERSDLIRVADYLEKRGLESLCKDIASRVKDGKKVSKAKYDAFVQEFVSTDRSLESLLREAGMNPQERAGVMASIKGKEEIVEFGRSLGIAANYEYPEVGIKAWARKAAEKMAKVNITDLFGGAKFLGHMLKQDIAGKPRMKFSEYLTQEYEKGYSKWTSKVSLGKTLKYGTTLALIGGVAFLVARCSGVIGGPEAKEETRPAVKRREKTAVEAELYASTSTRGKYPAIAELIGKAGIAEEEQKKVASIVAKLPRQFIQGSTPSELENAIIVINALTPLLAKKISKDQIAATALDIMKYVEPSQAKQFADALAKSAKSEKEIAAFFDSPPAGITMTEEWLRRPFAAFTDAKFDTRDEKLALLCKTIRQTRVKKGRESVPLPVGEQNEYAEALAAVYTPSRGRPKVPDTYQAELQFLIGMKDRGFAIKSAGKILETLKFVYKPQYLDKVADGILKSLKPSMSEEEMRLAIEAPAFESRGYANDAWEKSTDPRLLRVLTEGRDAQSFSANLRQFPQGLYEDALEILVAFTGAWQSEKRVLTNRDITPLVPMLESLTRSRELAHLPTKERGQILYKLVTSVKPGKVTVGSKRRRRTVEPTGLAMRNIAETFAGKTPTAQEVLDSIDAFLAENPGFSR